MYRACLYLIEGEEGYFCLKLKEWNEPCPKECPRNVPATSANYTEVETKKYDIKCQHCTRILSRQDFSSRPVFYCSLLEMEEPMCEECEFPLYNPKIEKNYHNSN